MSQKDSAADAQTEDMPPRYMDWTPTDEVHVTTGLGYEVSYERGDVDVESRFVVPEA